MKVAEFVKYGFNNTSFTVTNKASNMAMSVSLLINFHKLSCPVIQNYRNYTISVFVKVLKVLVRNYTVYSKTAMKVIISIYPHLPV